MCIFEIKWTTSLACKIERQPVQLVNGTLRDDRSGSTINLQPIWNKRYVTRRHPGGGGGNKRYVTRRHPGGGGGAGHRYQGPHYNFLYCKMSIILVKRCTHSIYKLVLDFSLWLRVKKIEITIIFCEYGPRFLCQWQLHHKSWFYLLYPATLTVVTQTALHRSVISHL